MTRRPLRVLHTADVHLGSDGYGTADEQVAHGDRERRMFRSIVDRALADRVDLLLIAGDLFDHNRVPAETVEFVGTELARLPAPVVILPGNHDCLATDALYRRHAFAAHHIHLLRDPGGETIEFPELDTIVWGRGMEEHELGFRPLAHLPARDDRRWCLAMAHGFFHEEGARPDRSSPIFADEIRDAGWDYVALGHHHVQTDVSQGRVAAWYAGAPGTVLRIDCTSEDGVRVEIRPL